MALTVFLFSDIIQKLSLTLELGIRILSEIVGNFVDNFVADSLFSIKYTKIVISNSQTQYSTVFRIIFISCC